jgi:integrase
MAIVPRKTKAGTVYYVVLRVDGVPSWRKAGSVKAEAKALEAKWKAQLAAGTYDAADVLPAAPTLEEYSAVWLKARTNRTAKGDHSLFRLHVLPYAVAREKLGDVRPRHVRDLVEQLRAKGLTDKTIANVLGVLRTMFRDALIAELAYTQPVVLPKNTLRRRRLKDPEIYQPGECLVLMRHHDIPTPVRVLFTLLFCTGMRQGEAVGLRWRSAQQALGLDALHVREQYQGKPLKTDMPRVVPVHPELAPVLTWWATEGWHLWVGRQPGPEDFVVPAASGGLLTKSAGYKALRKACKAVGIPWRGIHGTRHTFITLCKRGGADHRALTTITHNPRGDIVDGYTRQDWEPLCSAIRCLSFDQDLRISLPSGNHGKNPFLSTTPVSNSFAMLPEKTDQALGSIPGASTTIPAVERRRSNEPSNAVALAVVAAHLGVLPADRSWADRAEAAIAELEAA